jgi:hypothetical protein
MACFCSTITSQGQADKAEQHHRPGRRFRGRWFRDEYAKPHDLPGVVDAFGNAIRKARTQVDDLTVAPFNGGLAPGFANTPGG